MYIPATDSIYFQAHPLPLEILKTVTLQTVAVLSENKSKYYVDMVRDGLVTPLTNQQVAQMMVILRARNLLTTFTD